MRPCVPHRSIRTTLGRFSVDGDFNRRRGLYIKAVLPKMPGASSFPKTGRSLAAATVSQARWRDGNNFRGCATNRNLSLEDYGRLLPLPLQDLLQAGRKCRRRRGLGRSSKDLNRKRCPDYPARRVIDRMRHWSIVGSVGPLHGPSRRWSHAKVWASLAVPRVRTSLFGPTTSHLGQCCRSTFRRTRRTNQMCSTNSLRLRRRHHRLLVIHRRRHSDRRAATLRGSGPVSGPVAGRASRS